MDLRIKMEPSKVLLGIVLFCLFIFYTSYASGEVIPDDLANNVKISDEVFFNQELQTGKQLSVTGIVTNQNDKPVTIWISLYSWTTNHNPWQLNSTETSKPIIIPSHVSFRYHISAIAVQPGAYRMHTQVIVENGKTILGQGETINVKGSEIHVTNLQENTISLKSQKNQSLVVLSTSMISGLDYNNSNNQISFKVSGDKGPARPETIIPVGKILHGPYFITLIDSIPMLNYQTISDAILNETFLKLTYNSASHYITIEGSKSIPEFSTINQCSDTEIFLNGTCKECPSGICEHVPEFGSLALVVISLSITVMLVISKKTRFLYFLGK